MKITRAIRVSHLGDDKLMTTLLGDMLTVTIDQSEGISGADIPEQAVKKMRTGSAALSLSSPLAFFAFPITERLSTTISEPGTGYRLNKRVNSLLFFFSGLRPRLSRLACLVFSCSNF